VAGSLEHEKCRERFGGCLAQSRFGWFSPPLWDSFKHHQHNLRLLRSGPDLFHYTNNPEGQSFSVENQGQIQAQYRPLPQLHHDDGLWLQGTPNAPAYPCSLLFESVFK